MSLILTNEEGTLLLFTVSGWNVHQTSVKSLHESIEVVDNERRLPVYEPDRGYIQLPFCVSRLLRMQNVFLPHSPPLLHLTSPLVVTEPLFSEPHRYLFFWQWLSLWVLIRIWGKLPEGVFQSGG